MGQADGGRAQVEAASAARLVDRIDLTSYGVSGRRRRKGQLTRDAQLLRAAQRTLELYVAEDESIPWQRVADIESGGAAGVESADGAFHGVAVQSAHVGIAAESAAQQRERNSAQVEVLVEELYLADLAFDALAASAVDVLARDGEAAGAHAFDRGGDRTFRAEAREPDGGIAILDTGGVQFAVEREARRRRPRAIAVYRRRALTQLPDTKDPRDIDQRGTRGVLEIRSRISQVIQRAGKIHLRGRGGDFAGINRYPVFLHGDGEIQPERLGTVVVVREIERRHGDGAAIARASQLVGEADVQVFAAGGERS